MNAMQNANQSTRRAVFTGCPAILITCALFPVADPVSAADPSPVLDVALSDGGTVFGRVVDRQGNALADSPIVVLHGGHRVARVVTCRDGSWRIKGLRGGLHRIVSGDGHSVVRLWTADSAPPNARRSLLSVSAATTVRGQALCCPMYFPMVDPCDVLTLGLSAAALIVAIDANNDANHNHAPPATP